MAEVATMKPYGFIWQTCPRGWSGAVIAPLRACLFLIFDI
jgi:hypothetical protein